MGNLKYIENGRRQSDRHGVSYSLIDIGLYTCVGITVQLVSISELLQQVANQYEIVV
jgi:hypothetical protein